MGHYFIELDGSLQKSLKDLPQWPVERQLEPLLAAMDGDRRFARLVGALPEGVDMYSATDDDLDASEFLQAGGSTEAMLLQLSVDEEARKAQMYNIALTRPDTSRGLTARIEHGGGHTDVYPEEVMTAEQALPIFVHYVRNGQTLPKGLWLRDFNDDDAQPFQV